jgi:hypothetical protein
MWIKASTFHSFHNFYITVNFRRQYDEDKSSSNYKLMAAGFLISRPSFLLNVANTTDSLSRTRHAMLL